VPAVYYDNFDAGFQAADYVIRQGARDVLYVAGLDLPWAVSRFDGIRAAYEAHRLDASALRSAWWRSEQGAMDQEEAAFLVTRSPLQEKVPDTVIGSNDRAALGASQSARELGLIAGRDFALIGFDDTPEATETGLTSFQAPLEDMAVAAARLAMNASAGKTANHRACFHSHVIVRHSTSCLRGGPAK
jgi:LacI family transcriptional regulator